MSLSLISYPSSFIPYLYTVLPGKGCPQVVQNLSPRVKASGGICAPQ